MLGGACYRSRYRATHAPKGTVFDRYGVYTVGKRTDIGGFGPRNPQNASFPVVCSVAVMRLVALPREARGACYSSRYRATLFAMGYGVCEHSVRSPFSRGFAAGLVPRPQPPYPPFCGIPLGQNLAFFPRFCRFCDFGSTGVGQNIRTPAQTLQNKAFPRPDPPKCPLLRHPMMHA